MKNPHLLCVRNTYFFMSILSFLEISNANLLISLYLYIFYYFLLTHQVPIFVIIYLKDIKSVSQVILLLSIFSYYQKK